MFWSGYPWWKHFSSPSAFTSHAFPPPDPPSLPHGVQLRILTHTDAFTERALLEQVCIFLYNHFAKQPRLVFHPNTLLPPRDYLLVLIHTDSSILGTIRYHSVGDLHTKETQHAIHLVDAFCLHPDHRGKRWGSLLLLELHALANRLGIPHALFLKEGSCLPVLPLPFYSGRYVYRRLPSSGSLGSLDPSAMPIYSLNPLQAQEWIATYRVCQPQTFLMIHPASPSQNWRFYRKYHRWVLACFQDTHQRWMTPEGKERMGWCTVWLESPDLTVEQRQEASLLLSDSVSAHFDWIWTNQQWTGGEPPWKTDGWFHWYTYQWTTNLSMRQSYALMN